MERQLKLIWDFRGPVGLQTAKHHEIHLREYVKAEGLALTIIGHEAIHEMHAIAFLVLPESQMIPIRDALKPHRGEVFEYWLTIVDFWFLIFDFWFLSRNFGMI